jgi:hypothetical protein
MRPTSRTPAETSMKPAAQLAHAAMTAATRGNIAIYPIHPGGTDLPDSFKRDFAPARQAGEIEKVFLHDGAADHLAEATGGFAHVKLKQMTTIPSLASLCREQRLLHMLASILRQEKDNGLYRARHGAS